MHKAHRRHGARRRGWPFIAAMMAGAEAQSGFGASARFGGSDWGFDFGPRKGRANSGWCCSSSSPTSRAMAMS